jgi:hypothetical protein
MTCDKPSLRERRLSEATKRLAQTKAKRAGAIQILVRTELTIRELERKVQRLSRPAIVKPKSPTPMPTATESVAADLSVPDFLRRTPADAKAKDDAARAAIAAEQTERKRAKASGRIAKLKAKQGGDLDRMPLTGKAALARIAGED